MPGHSRKPPIRAWRAADIGRDAMQGPVPAEELFGEAAPVRRGRLARQLRQERRLGRQGGAGYDLARHLRLRRALICAPPGTTT